MNRWEFLLHVGLLPVKYSFRAVQQDNLDICTILVNTLCDLEAKTTDGLTALHYAVGYRRYGIAELLMKV